MHKAISKYGLAAHLALLAVAPLFLFPFCGEIWTARTVIWLSLVAACWTVLEPSRRVDETLHDARFRVASSIVLDPLFWFSLGLILIAAIRWLNGGIGMVYDAEKSVWSLSEAPVPFFPGATEGSGYLPFAAVVGVTVLMQAGRHALGKSARVCFLFAAAFLAGIAAVVAGLACVFENPVALHDATGSTVDATYPGVAFGLCFMGSMVAIAGAFERKWNRAMPFLAIAVGGTAVGLYLFSSGLVIVVHAACAIVIAIYALVYVQRRIGGLVVPKCLAFLLIAAILPILFVMGVVPESINEQKLVLFFGEEGAHLVPDGFFELRSALSGIAEKVWKENPWLGTGLGTFGLDIRFNASEADWAVFASNQTGALNGWMQMLAERGILGVVFFVAPLLFLLWTYVLRAFCAVSDIFRNSRRSFGALVFHPVCALGPFAVVAVALCGFYDHSFWRAEAVMLVAAIFAMAGSAFPAPKKRDDDTLTEK
ncbi:MAG: O-antigen ligase family protein [Kiritimatiellae bacterium]|nr:O-antigen ligase family protein [Kiritimatiellia bacterium]